MFKINEIDILDPTTHRWVPRNQLGINGLGHTMYSGVREYEMTWQLSSIGDFYLLMSMFSALSGTNTVTALLPSLFSTGTYTPFTTYSGCVLQEPEYDQWFNGYYQDVTLLISKIRT